MRKVRSAAEARVLCAERQCITMQAAPALAGSNPGLPDHRQGEDPCSQVQSALDALNVLHSTRLQGGASLFGSSRHDSSVWSSGGSRW